VPVDCIAEWRVSVITQRRWQYMLKALAIS
jgi:hypothetical protein